MRYLLDTNIISDLVRSPQGKIAERIANVGEESVCTSIIVAAELRYGAAKKSSARLTAQLESVLGALEILAFEEATSESDVAALLPPQALLLLLFLPRSPTKKSATARFLPSRGSRSSMIWRKFSLRRSRWTSCVLS